MNMMIKTKLFQQDSHYSVNPLLAAEKKHDFEGLGDSQWELKCENALVPLDFVSLIILHKKSKN